MDRSSKIADLNDQCQALETKFNQAADGHDALGIATKAAELAFKALQLSSSRDQKAVIRKKLEFFLAEAEQIKANHQWRPKADKIPKTHSRSPLLKLREPVSMRQLPQAEVRILFGASELNTFRFPPWDGPPNSWEMAKSYDGRPYLESPDLPLSSMQRDVFKGWRRPNVALLPLAERGNTAERTQPSMEVDGETDLVQDAVTDCSVVASLCADSARTSRGQEKIIPSALWPQDSSGKPQLCEQGKYLARLNFNGCFRRVIVDDRLPISNVRMLHVSDRRQPNLLWPAIIEKAYLKVHGGYDFPGSNSGTDLWMLTGWIPEQVFLQRQVSS
ncbi:MAG: cysteine protease [Bogoriella megaspora]|nr:MAG: cysteine protease [Bogoriella megaspora]